MANLIIGIRAKITHIPIKNKIINCLEELTNSNKKIKIPSNILKDINILLK